MFAGCRVLNTAAGARGEPEAVCIAVLSAKCSTWFSTITILERGEHHLVLTLEHQHEVIPTRVKVRAIVLESSHYCFRVEAVI